jgi:uncharacterized membrane protein HdeD (DUF308 family)
MATADPNVVVVEEEDLAAIGKHWGLVLALGIVSIIVGIIAMVWPGATVLVLAILVGAWLLVSGIFQIIRGFQKGLSGGMRALMIILGGLSVIIGLFALSGVWRAVEILYLFIAIGFLFQGIGLLFTAGDRFSSRGWDIFGGIVMLIGGVVILVWPVRSLVVLAWVAGIWLVIGGIVEIIAAFKLRSLGKA